MTSAEVDISGLDEDGFRNQLSPEPHNEFLTHETLFSMSSVEQLRMPTLALLKNLKTRSVENGVAVEMPRFSEEDIDEAMIGFNLMADLHRGRTRRNTGYDEATHPALVGILDLLANPDLTVDQLVTDYLHDTIEDCGDLGITSRHIRRLLEIDGYPKTRASMIALGVEGLTRDDPDDQEGYKRKIITYDKDQRVAPLRIRERKLVDTRHTMMSYTREMKNNLVDPKKAKAYADGKAGGILLAFGKSKFPNTSGLEEAISEFNGELADRNERAHHATRNLTAPRTLFTARVRV
jgi:hypothetical protein